MPERKTKQLRLDKYSLQVHSVLILLLPNSNKTIRCTVFFFLFVFFFASVGGGIKDEKRDGIYLKT